MRQVQILAPAKVNLALRILGRREDGYHMLESFMQKIDLYDRLTVVRQERGVALSCCGSDLPEGEDNLAHRAAMVFMEALPEGAPGGAGVAITLEKHIPVAAGLGGGSSDAAAVLRAMNLLFGQVFSEADLVRMALRLGADVPFLVQKQPAAWAGGIGEELVAAVPLTGWFMVLVTPEIAVSTKWAYETFALTALKKNRSLPSSQKTDRAAGSHPPHSLKSIGIDEMVNDLEPVTIGRFPEIAALKTMLMETGAASAMMSGSGPTVFGLFTEEQTARDCIASLGPVYRQVYLVRPLSVAEPSPHFGTS